MTTEDSPHLTAEDVAAYLDRRLTTAERSGIEAHLAHCRQCRREITESRRLVVASPIGRQRYVIPAGIAAAAAITFAVVTLNRPGTGPESDPVRTPSSETVDSSVRISVISPADGDTISQGHPTLLWSTVSGEPTYRLTITDASGQPVWTTSTTDTALALPANITLQPRTKYFWYVDALRADGRAVSTGVRSFTTSP